MANLGTSGVEAVTYYSSCGHTLRHRSLSPQSGLPTCAMQPRTHYILPNTSYSCQGCANGVSKPLTGRALREMDESIDALISEEDAFRLAVSARNEPEEERLCSKPSLSLSLHEARQIYTLIFQLENVIGVVGFKERHDVDFSARRKRLRVAICSLPFSLIEDFNLEEKLIHVETVHGCLQNAFFHYYHLAPRAHRSHFRGEVEAIITTIDTLTHALWEIMEPIAADNPEFLTRLMSVQRMYFSVLTRFNPNEDGVELARRNNQAEDERRMRIATVQRLVQSGRVEDMTDIYPNCPICKEPILQPPTQQEFAARLPDCGHVYCSECLFQWLCVETSCPTCRREYKAYL